MNTTEILQKTEAFVKETLEGAEAGHDWSHIKRVVRNARLISKGEDVDDFIVEISALLHDIADSKFHDGDEGLGPIKARAFLNCLNLPESSIEHIINIIKYVSFKNELDLEQMEPFKSSELDVVKDADRLDAIGAIGIARTFHYGGYKNRSIYDPETPPNLKLSKEEYKKSTAPTINHFYEKLLLLKDGMKTTTGRQIAEQRHQFMEEFLEQFFSEWEGRI